MATKKTRETRAMALDEAVAWSQTPPGGEPWSSLTGRPFLLLETDAAARSLAEQERLAAWLRSLAVPVIGFAPASASGPVPAACDVRVTDTAEAAKLIKKISSAPIAASVLVQLLRLTPAMAVEDALIAESLAYATLQGGAEFKAWLAQHEPVEPLAEEGPPVLLSRIEHTLQIELNRPANRNAISVAMRDALLEAFALVAADPTIQRAHLTGRGKCFSVGGDLAEFGSVPDPATGHAVRSVALPARLLAACAGRVDCHLHGACIGAGIELPSFAHRLTASSDAYFQLPELKFGLIPGAGGCVGIPRRIGRQRTAWLALSGKRIDAKTALEWGLVDSLVD